MKKVDLAYGRTGLTISIPESADILVSQYIPGLPDETRAIRHALRHPVASSPLHDKVQPGETVVIVHSDLTRATPNDLILPVLLAELEQAGIHRRDITLLNGLGTHRLQTDAELRILLGDSIVDNYRCLQHDAFDDDNLIPLGHTSLDNPVRINRHFLQADRRILTGFIEPHFFAGFSGGPKAILPALAGVESVLSNHSWQMIAHPQATWGVCEGNPLWEEMREVALRTEPDFLLNVALNAGQEITAVFAGDLIEAHRSGRDFVRRQAMAAVEDPYDIVITTNSGYPLDQNLYQTVKGMSAAARILRAGGTIIMAAACEDGLPDHGLYATLLAQADSPQAVLDLIEKAPLTRHDQWQVQIQATIQLRADIHVYSHNLTDDQITRALFTPCRDIEGTGTCRICVMPEGPQTIAYIAP
jgi:nickel-dependent lactate racemase